MTEMKWRAAAGVGVGVGALLAWWAWRRAHSDTPTRWEVVGEVSELVIYPLKLGHGVKVTEAEATRYGLAHDLLEDRSFVATTKDGSLVSRYDHRMIDVTVTLAGSMVTLRARGHEEVRFDLQDVTRAGKVVEMRESMKGYDCGDEVAAWLTKVIHLKSQEDFRLVYNGDLTQHRAPSGYSLGVGYDRHSKDPPTYIYKHFKPSDRIVYAQHAAYMLASETSLADLNARLLERKPVTLDWFRPNLVVGGMKRAYDEDDWAFVRIGDVVLRRVKPCSKHLFGYVDPETGARSSREESDFLSKVLISTRRQKGPKELAWHWERTPVFGVHLGIDTCGKVRVGDKVEVARASWNPRWQY